MHVLKYSKQFKKDLKRFSNDKVILLKLEYLLDFLVANEKIDKKYHKHSLSGEFKNCKECHIQPDLLLVYRVKNSELLILLIRFDSHSEIF